MQVTEEVKFQENPSLRGPLSVLVLCDDNCSDAATVSDHIKALKKHSRHDVRLFDPVDLSQTRFLDLDEFDAVVIHYSLVIISDHCLAPALREKVRQFRGLKIQFIQDEQRWVDKITAMMRYLGIHILFTVATPSEASKLYEKRLPGVVKIHTLTGYVADYLIAVPTLPVESRTIDIGYRGRTNPYWMGELTQEKVWIGQGVLERAAEYELRCDIAWGERDRIYGKKWIKFISSCKATLGTESGASIADFDGTVERQVKEYLLKYPGVDFRTIRNAVLQPFEENVRIHVISPRIFEAAALRTALILFPGEYSGIVHPWVHYIPLEKDFSNMGQVAEKLRDLDFLKKIAERTHRDLIASGRYSYRAFVREFDDTISKYGKPRGKRVSLKYTLAATEKPFSAPRRFVVQLLSRIGLLNHIRETIEGGAALRVTLASGALRRVLSRYLLNAAVRKEVRIHLLFEDLLRLHLSQRIRKEDGIPPHLADVSLNVSYQKNDCTLRFQSIPKQRYKDNATWQCLPSFSIDSSEAVELKQIIWDHSAIARSVPCPIVGSKQLALAMEPNGMHEFKALSVLARHYPKEIWRAIFPQLP